MAENMKHVDEAVDKILARGHTDWPLVRQAITTAVGAERERFDAIADMARGENPSCGWRSLAKQMAEQIRARGEGVKRG